VRSYDNTFGSATQRIRKRRTEFNRRAAIGPKTPNEFRDAARRSCAAFYSPRERPIHSKNRSRREQKCRAIKLKESAVATCPQRAQNRDGAIDRMTLPSCRPCRTVVLVAFFSIGPFPAAQQQYARWHCFSAKWRNGLPPWRDKIALDAAV
jgi:hypothetical protein